MKKAGVPVEFWGGGNFANVLNIKPFQGQFFEVILAKGVSKTGVSRKIVKVEVFHEGADLRPQLFSEGGGARRRLLFSGSGSGTRRPTRSRGTAPTRAFEFGFTPKRQRQGAGQHELD